MAKGDFRDRLGIPDQETNGASASPVKPTGRQRPTAAPYQSVFQQGSAADELWRMCLVPFLKPLYTHNPFYLISACLILLGLNVTFGTSTDAASAWILMAVLAGYTLLMAATALLIIHLGKVWDDARSVLMVVALLLLAVTVSFDETLLKQPLVGRWLLVVGFAFAVLVSEGLLRGLRIRLGVWFRAPYYAILGLFFAYPLLLQYLLRLPSDSLTDNARWAVLWFPTAAGLVFLLLLPAIRKGAEYVRDNGTPWRWPWFPWTLFGLLALGVIVRSYCLTLSFDPQFSMDSIFGSYFLVPFVMSLAVLLLELGVVSRKTWAQVAALAMPLFAVILAVPSSGPNPAYGAFLAEIRGVFGSPVFLAAVGAVLFYVYAVVRGVALAPHALSVGLVVASVIGRGTVGLGSLVIPQALPLLLAALVQGWLALQRRSSICALLAIGLIVLAATTCFSGTWFTDLYGAIPAHLLYGAVLLTAALFHDRAARVLQDAAAYVFIILLTLTLVYRQHLAGVTTAGLPLAYAALIVAAPFVYGWLVRNILHLFVGLIDLGIAGAWAAATLYGHLQTVYGPKATLPFFGAGLAFLVAVVISFSKIRGVVGRMAAAIARCYRQAPGAAPPGARQVTA